MYFLKSLKVMLILTLWQEGTALAGVITSGAFSVGIGSHGTLYDPSANVGFRRNSDSYDPILPGNPRDSWGISAGSVSIGVHSSFSFPLGITSSSTYSPSAATVASTTSLGLSVVHQFAFLDPNVLAVDATITNNSSSSTSVLYQRAVDFDLLPTLFDEWTQAPAVPPGGFVIASTADGFAVASPLSSFLLSCTSGCSTFGDRGAGIRLDLGTLSPGQSIAFRYYYGINTLGQSPSGLLSQVQTLAGTAPDFYALVSYGSDGNINTATYSAILAVSRIPGAEVPEPTTSALIGGGLLALGLALRRRT